MDLVDVGLRITRARREKGWNQKDLATNSGYSQQTISMVERGELHRLATVQQVAAAVGLKVELVVEALTGDEEGAA